MISLKDLTLALEILGEDENHDFNWPTAQMLFDTIPPKKPCPYSYVGYKCLRGYAHSGPHLLEVEAAGLPEVKY